MFIPDTESAINLKSLEHTFGNAEDAPANTFNLLSNDLELREGAIEELGQSIDQQRIVCQARG